MNGGTFCTFNWLFLSPLVQTDDHPPPVGVAFYSRPAVTSSSYRQRDGTKSRTGSSRKMKSHPSSADSVSSTIDTVAVVEVMEVPLNSKWLWLCMMTKRGWQTVEYILSAPSLQNLQKAVTKLQEVELPLRLILPQSTFNTI